MSSAKKRVEKLSSPAKQSTTYVTGIAVEKDYLRLATYRDDIDPYEVDETRMCTFDEQMVGDEWNHDDVPMHIISMCLWTGASSGKRAYVALSWEGEVEILVQGADNPIVETIQDAGLHGDWSGDFGYVMDIACIGKTLYVCGDARQVYRRQSNGKWVHADAGILLAPGTVESAAADSRCFMAINGLREDSIYAAGTDGELFHFDGKTWKQLPLNTDEQLLTIKIVSETEIYVAGSNGTLLKGNVNAGFKDISSVDDNMRISSVEKYADQIYVASNLGLFVYDEKAKNLQPLKTNLKPELADANVVQAVDGTLWSIGFKDLAFFDGTSWTRIDHPDNDPIR